MNPIRHSSFDWNLLELRILKSVCLAWFLGMLSVFIFYPPYWAFMDDQWHVKLAFEGFEGKSFARYVLDFVDGDFGWGMFRPMYAIFIYLFYGAFKHSSQAAYLFIFLLNVSIFYFWAVLFEKYAAEFFKQSKNRESLTKFRWLFLIFCLLFSPNYTLFFFASLQERLVLLFGAAAFYGFYLVSSAKKPRVRDLFIFLSGLTLAAFSKATAIFLSFPFCFWFVIRAAIDRKTAWLKTGIFMMLCFIGLSYFFWSIRGSYTGDYQLSQMWAHWAYAGERFNRPLRISFISMTVILLTARFLKINFLRCFYLLVWPLSLIFFLCLMLPWKSVINYYLIVPGGLFWTACKVILCLLLIQWLKPVMQRPVFFIIIAVSIIVSIPSARKFWKTAQQHHGTGQVVQFLKKDLAPYKDEEIWARMPPPCIEASDAMSVYLGRLRVIQLLNRSMMPSELSDTSRYKRKLLITNGECSEVDAPFVNAEIKFRHGPWFVREIQT